MEGVLPPFAPVPSYEAMGEDMGQLFRSMRDPVSGRELIIEQNMFVNGILPSLINRSLSEEAQSAYEAPYRDPEDRLPIWMWPREVPIGGEPASSVAVMERIQAFMEETKKPVLLLYAEPGAVVPLASVEWYKETIAEIETSFIGQGLHFVQEDQPVAIGRALDDWLRRHSD